MVEHGFRLVRRLNRTQFLYLPRITLFHAFFASQHEIRATRQAGVDAGGKALARSRRWIRVSFAGELDVRLGSLTPHLRLKVSSTS